MKRLFIIFVVMTMSLRAESQDVITYFDNPIKIQSDGETASLYSVRLSDKYTYVTIELIPTINRSRVTYFTSGYTHIQVGPYYKIRLLGALSNDGKSYHSCEPDDGWGWSKCKIGERYHYTLVFDGRIPYGHTNFTMVDDYGAYHGYSFRNYTIKNPDVVEKTGYTENMIRQHALSDNDGIVGIYEDIEGQSGYKLGCIKSGNDYKLVYLDGSTNLSWWKRGDLKSYLTPTSTVGLYKAGWYTVTKELNEALVGFDGTQMTVKIGDNIATYVKTYPTYVEVHQPSSWSGSGIEINNGYVVTNYHVVEGAKKIIVQRVVNNREEKFTAETVATDKVNDLALIKIVDSQYYKYQALPFSVKFSTSDVGESCYALGYPMISTMGTEIKLTTGVISSKSGFQGDVSTYQVSVPVQPGNSGGPLFNYNGELIGIINAKHTEAENASYAIKTAYVRNLVESFTNDNLFPLRNTLINSDLPNQVKSVKPFIYMILCSQH